MYDMQDGAGERFMAFICILVQYISITVLRLRLKRQLSEVRLRRLRKLSSKACTMRFVSFCCDLNKLKKQETILRLSSALCTLFNLLRRHIYITNFTNFICPFILD